MTPTDDQDAPRQDWTKLAKDALDIWQSHLTALASDEKAKDDLAKMMAPMTQMAGQWANVMQKSFQDLMTTGTSDSSTMASPPPPSSSSDATSHAPEPDAAVSDPALSVEPAGVQDFVPDQPVPAPVAPASPSGRSASADGPRDLAELAGRLAELERELDSLRPRTKRAGGDRTAATPLSDDGASALRTAGDGDSGDVGDVQRVAGTHPG